MPVLLKFALVFFRCDHPDQMVGVELHEVFDKHHHMRCSDRFGSHPEHDGAILIGILVGEITLNLPWMVKSLIFSVCRFAYRNPTVHGYHTDLPTWLLWIPGLRAGTSRLHSRLLQTRRSAGRAEYLSLVVSKIFHQKKLFSLNLNCVYFVYMIDRVVMLFLIFCLRVFLGYWKRKLWYRKYDGVSCRIKSMQFIYCITRWFVLIPNVGHFRTFQTLLCRRLSPDGSITL